MNDLKNVNVEEQKSAKNPFDVKKFESMVQPRSLEARERAQWLRKNRKWLKMSKDVALCIHYYLRMNNMTQKELADKMNVSAAYIGKILKGEENLTLETICKIQDAIGSTIVTIQEPYVIRDILTLSPSIQKFEDVKKSSIYKCTTSTTEEFTEDVVGLVS